LTQNPAHPGTHRWRHDTPTFSLYRICSRRYPVSTRIIQRAATTGDYTAIFTIIRIFTLQSTDLFGTDALVDLSFTVLRQKKFTATTIPTRTVVRIAVVAIGNERRQGTNADPPTRHALPPSGVALAKAPAQQQMLFRSVERKTEVLLIKQVLLVSMHIVGRTRIRCSDEQNMYCSSLNSVGRTSEALPFCPRRAPSQ